MEALLSEAIDNSKGPMLRPPGQGAPTPNPNPNLTLALALALALTLALTLTLTMLRPPWPRCPNP